MVKHTPTPVDYLVIGHVTKDLTPEGPVLGGTAAYVGRTALAFGLRVGVLTSCAGDIDLQPLEGLCVVTLPTERSTTFENKYTVEGRTQYLHAVATTLAPQDAPMIWHDTPIVHLAPIAAEVEPSLSKHFGDALLCMTPQGWLRRWDESGKIHLNPWHDLLPILPDASAVVISLEDLGGDVEASRAMAAHCTILAVTEGAKGARVFWRGEERHFSTPLVAEVDPTGAGDVFAAAFFIKLYQATSPWEAARIANTLAAYSVTRKGYASTPTPQEVQITQEQVLQ